jgi:hypothetical protein
MTKFTHLALLAAVFAVALLSVGASAQTTHVIKAHVPFEFNVGTKVYPAGDYTVVESLQNLLTLRNDQGRNVAVILTHSVESASVVSTPELRFRLDQGQYALRQVWLGESSSGDELSRSKSMVVETKQVDGGRDSVVIASRP